jgi:hypothetical protein
MLVHPPDESLSLFRKQDSVIRALAVVCFAMVFLCPMRSLAGQCRVGNPTQICNVSHLAKMVSVDQVQFRSYKNDDSGEACMQVTQNGKLLFQRTNDNGGYFTLGQQASGDGTVVRIGDEA